MAGAGPRTRVPRAGRGRGALWDGGGTGRPWRGGGGQALAAGPSGRRWPGPRALRRFPRGPAALRGCPESPGLALRGGGPTPALGPADPASPASLRRPRLRQSSMRRRESEGQERRAGTAGLWPWTPAVSSRGRAKQGRSPSAQCPGHRPGPPSLCIPPDWGLTAVSNPGSPLLPTRSLLPAAGCIMPKPEPCLHPFAAFISLSSPTMPSRNLPRAEDLTPRLLLHTHCLGHPWLHTHRPALPCAAAWDPPAPLLHLQSQFSHLSSSLAPPREGGQQLGGRGACQIRVIESHPCVPDTPGPVSLAQVLPTEQQALTGTGDPVPGCPSQPGALPTALHTDRHRILGIKKILFFHGQTLQQLMLQLSPSFQMDARAPAVTTCSGMVTYPDSAGPPPSQPHESVSVLVHAPHFQSLPLEGGE